MVFVGFPVENRRERHPSVLQAEFGSIASRLCISVILNRFIEGFSFLLPLHDPSTQPTRKPTNQPTSQPSVLPTNQPSGQPTSRPSHSFVNVVMKLVAGRNVTGFSGDGSSATSAHLFARIPFVAPTGDLYIPDGDNSRIRKVDTAGIISTFGGTGTKTLTGAGGTFPGVGVNYPYCIVGNGAAALFISDMLYVWRYQFSGNGVIVFAHSSTLPAGFSGDTGLAVQAQLNCPLGLWFTTSGALYIADFYNHRIRKIVSSIITTVVGSGSIGSGSFSGDDGFATSATLNNPIGVFMDTAGKLFLTDTSNYRIRMVDTNSIITTFAGTGTPFPYNGDNRPAILVNIHNPQDVKGDTLGNIYIADFGNCVVRMVDIRGILSNVFGTPGDCGFSSGVSDRRAKLAQMQGLWMDSLSHLYISDGNSIHKSMLADSPTSQPSTQPTSSPTMHPRSFDNVFMQLIAGASSVGYSGDNGPATEAQIQTLIPWVDSVGNVYLPDSGNNRIRKINSGGIITTFGGTGLDSTTGLGGSITAVDFHVPVSIVGDIAGSCLYISDLRYVWKYSFNTNIIAVFAHAPGAAAGFSGDGGQASSAQLNTLGGLWLTTDDVLYIADFNNNRIRKVAANIITTVVGSGNQGGFSGNGGFATSAVLNGPNGVYMDSQGKLFIADYYNNRIRSVATNQIITTFAGSGAPNPFNGDNIPALAANIPNPWDVKGDTLGNIFISDYGNCIIRMVDTKGIISTLFGTSGVCGLSSGLTSRSSTIYNPLGIWVDSDSNIYFTDKISVHRSVVVSSPTSQPSRRPSSQPSQQPSSSPSYHSRSFENVFMQVVAGVGSFGTTGDNGPATDAQIRSYIPCVDTVGNVYIPTDLENRVRKVDTTGTITNFGGTGSLSTAGAAGPILSVSFFHPQCIVGDTAGVSLYISDARYVWRYEFSSNIVAVFAGNPAAGFSGDNGPGFAAALFNPIGLWFTTSGSLYIADAHNQRIRKVSSGIITTVVGSGPIGAGLGSFSGDNGPATSAKLRSPSGVYMDSVGNLFIADQDNYRVRRVDTNNIITTFAGTGVLTPFNGENIPATSANIYLPVDIKGDTLGNIYIADNGYCVVRLIDRNGIISNLFGSQGVCAFTAGISPRSSAVRSVNGLWIDSLSNIYFSDAASLRRSVVLSPSSAPSGQPSTHPTTYSNVFMRLIAGTASLGHTGDNGQATSAQIYSRMPYVDSIGNIYVPDFQYSYIRKISNTGIISTMGGDGTVSTAGIGGPISSVTFSNPYSIVGDKAGSFLYISDSKYIWKYFFSTNIVSVYAGSRTLELGFSGDGGQASLAQFCNPSGLWLTTAGDLYVADVANHRIRKIVSSGIITTVAGSGAGPYGGDGGAATLATLNYPVAVYVDTVGKQFITDYQNYRIRLVDTNNIITTIAGNGRTGPWNGDNIPALTANMNGPYDAKGDSLGNIYIAICGSCSVRTLNSNTGILSTLFGTDNDCGFSPGLVTRRSSLECTLGLWLDDRANIYISDKNSIHRSVNLAPTSQPTSQPSRHPTAQPSRRPSSKPSRQPSDRPTSQPTCQPTRRPSSQPSRYPTTFPTVQPISGPSSQPTGRPTVIPSRQPFARPSSQPSSRPSSQPTSSPTRRPSTVPSNQPTEKPSCQPFSHPTSFPSVYPSVQPTSCPSNRPSLQPSCFPTAEPSSQPTLKPSTQPSDFPTTQPSVLPTIRPTTVPTGEPTLQPWSLPSSQPSSSPTNLPSGRPTTQPSRQPTRVPSEKPSGAPTTFPTEQPTNIPSNQPTVAPSTRLFSLLSALPTSQPTGLPSAQPSSHPSLLPSALPTSLSSLDPISRPSMQPPVVPSNQPISSPTTVPSRSPSTNLRDTRQPTSSPTNQPTDCPSLKPSSVPFCRSTEFISFRCTQ
jgi:sugar lactone lactonase YvrE